MTDFSDSSTSILNVESFSLLNKTCDYAGEGNCHILLSIKDEGLVLRLKKLDSHLKNYAGCEKNEFEELLNELLFYNRVMKLLIGEHFVFPLHLVSLNRSQLIDIVSELNYKRPHFRQSKIVNCNFGFLSVDFTSDKLIDHSENPTLCVEIKGKQGWFPDNLKKYKKCFYCMNQYLKLKKRAIKNISEYCPLELFSGNYSRMYTILLKLLENPQNNIKISISGHKVTDNEISDLEKSLNNYFQICGISMQNSVKILSNVIIKALLWNESEFVFFDHNENNITVENNVNLSNCCNESPSNLPKGCILEKILQIQLLEKDVIIGDIGNVTNFEYVDNLSLLLKNVENPSNFISDNLNSLEKYMLASIAKDCSIMISLKPIQKLNKPLKNEIYIEESSHNFIVKVGVIDIGPKPCNKINYHKERNKAVIENFLNS